MTGYSIWNRTGKLAFFERMSQLLNYLNECDEGCYTIFEETIPTTTNFIMSAEVGSGGHVSLNFVYH